jgi:hypothetical protein
MANRARELENEAILIVLSEGGYSSDCAMRQGGLTNCVNFLKPHETPQTRKLCVQIEVAGFASPA